VADAPELVGVGAPDVIDSIAVSEEISLAGIVTPADLQRLVATLRAFCTSACELHALTVQAPTVSMNLLFLQMQLMSVVLQLVEPKALVAHLEAHSGRSPRLCAVATAHSRPIVKRINFMSRVVNEG